jgi:hypothetical protein
MTLKNLAYVLIGSGALLLIGGLLLLAAHKLGLPLGRLPGDIHAEGKNWSFSFPLITCILLSIILTVLVNLFFRR